MDPQNPTTPPQTPVQTPPETPPPIVTPKSFPWKWILILIIFILLGGGATYYVANQNSQPAQDSKPTPTIASSPTPTPTPDPTADWMLYKSKYGFEFKHPKNAIIDKGVESIDGERVDFFYEKSSNPNYAYRWSLGVSVESTTRKSLNEVKQAYQTNQGEYSNFENINLGDKEALKFSHGNSGSNTINQFFAVLIINNREITISATRHDESVNIEILRSTFNQILSTFKFTQ